MKSTHGTVVRSWLICMVICAQGLLVVPAAHAADKMYWTHTADLMNYEIQRANLDGSEVETLLSGLEMVLGIALDLTNEKMYYTENKYTDPQVHRITRANLDGSDPVVLVNGNRPYGIALDVAGGKIYWTDQSGDIYRANLADGSGVESLVSTSGPYGIALDLDGGKMYWTDTDPDRIARANLDGSSVEELVTGLNRDTAIALDLDGGKMYWGDWVFSEGGIIRRANLDGSGLEEVLNIGMDPTPYGIALDLLNDKIYFTSTYTSSSILRANLDGSGTETLVTGLDHPFRLVLQLSPPPVPLARWPLAVLVLFVAAVTLTLRRYRTVT
jgi:DNA-binding beta-propeller fold protein YncE